ncbi:MAG: alpha/beta hydrolase [Streptomycetales bacterium]
MPLHPQAKEFLAVLAALGRPPRHTLTPEENREGMRLIVPYTGDVVELPAVEDRAVPGPGGPVPIRLYRPHAPGGPPPVVLYFHGGGWVLGDLDTHDRLCRSLAARTPCAVASVGYRLAPEHPFPAGLHDCVAAAWHIAEHGAEFGVDGGRLAVGGDSAGGNLAAVVSMLARDTRGPAIAHQLLVYPVVDGDTEGPESYRDFAEGYYLSRADMEWYFGHYLGADGDRADPRVSPLRAADHADLPPATVITAEFDPLRDEGEAYARALEAAGVPVSLRRYDGMIHPFFSLAGVLDPAREAQEWAATRLREALGVPGAA